MTELTDVLGVLDQASAARARRVELLAAVARVDSPHSIGELSAAVDIHLESQPISAAPSSSFDFGWDRPKTPADLDIKKTKTKQAKWALRQRNRGMDASPWLLWRLLWGIGGALVLGLIVAFGFNPRAGIAVSFLGFVLSLIAGAMANERITNSAAALWAYEPYLPSKADAKVLLEVAEAREYLRAVRSSAQPNLLIGDGRRLQELTAAHIQKQKDTCQAAAAKEVETLLALA